MRGLSTAESRHVAGGNESEPPRRQPGPSPTLWNELLARLERERADRYRKRH